MKLLTCAVLCLGLVLSARAFSLFGDEESSYDELMMGDDAAADKSMLRQNFPTECEASLNDLAQEYFKATYFYMSMGISLQKPDTNHAGFALMCMTTGKQKLKLAKAIMYYIHKRGGDVTSVDIEAPVPNDWQNPVKVLRQAIGRERQIGSKLLAAFKNANRHNDPFTHAFLEQEVMDKQSESLPEFVKYMSRFKKVGAQLGAMSGNVELIMKYKDQVMQCK